ncbi:MAG TPA: hypothetical protein P5262_01810 [Candidatus Moranbacteria bacterium]|nr:hypothetical protein [Candidatus Moranbacteria bacterium]
MFFPEDAPIISKLHKDAREILRKRQEFNQREHCPRCGSSRDKIDRGICKGTYISLDGKRSLCCLSW